MVMTGLADASYLRLNLNSPRVSFCAPRMRLGLVVNDPVFTAGIGAVSRSAAAAGRGPAPDGEQPAPARG